MAEPTALERRLAGEHRTLARPLRGWFAVRRRLWRGNGGGRRACGQHAEGSQHRGDRCAVASVGIFTSATWSRRARSGPRAADAEAMTRNPLALRTHPAYEAALAMIDHRFRHVLVTKTILARRRVGTHVFSLQRSDSAS